MSGQKNPITYLVLILCILISSISFSNTTRNQPSKQLIVVIDPGHGGKDPGAVNKAIREKDIVLSIGLKLGRLINENHQDVKVVFTRNTDVFVPLIERSRIANKSKADLFISIHANFCSTPAIRGTETFVLGLHKSKENLDVAKKENSVILLEEGYDVTYEGFDPNSPESYIMFELVQDIYMDQSLLFADAIQQQFKTRLGTVNRGVKQAGFLVLRQSSMPSVLVEAGFLSNQAEANYLSSDEGQEHIALSIFEAFKKFKGKSSGLVVNTNTENSGLVVSTNTELASAEKKQEVVPSTIKPVDTIKTQKPIAEANKEIILASVETKQSEPEKAVFTEKTPPVNPVIEEPKAVKDSIVPQTTNETFYSVQIGANTTPVEPVPGNFKGLKNIRREKTDKYYRYYVGKEGSLDKITPLLQQIKLKFPQAFVVSFVNGQRVLLNISPK